MSIEIKDALKRARALIARGWCQDTAACAGLPVGAYESVKVRYVADDNPGMVCYCVTGAVSALRVHYDLLGALEMTFSHRPLGPFYNLATWNDAPDRTHEEVLDLFDKAIAEHDDEL